MKNDEIRIPARAISLLVTMKQRMMEDSELCDKVTDCGKYAAARYIDELIQSALEIERMYHEIVDTHRYVKRENEEYTLLFDGFRPDMLNDEEKAEVQALVKKWEEKDESEENG